MALFRFHLVTLGTQKTPTTSHPPQSRMRLLSSSTLRGLRYFHGYWGCALGWFSSCACALCARSCSTISPPFLLRYCFDGFFAFFRLHSQIFIRIHSTIHFLQMETKLGGKRLADTSADKPFSPTRNTISNLASIKMSVLSATLLSSFLIRLPLASLLAFNVKLVSPCRPPFRM